MQKKYKCGMCGSESSDTPGSCCGKERNPSNPESCVVDDNKTEHTHKEGEVCEVCDVENK